MKRYWESLPSFLYQKDAEFCARRVEEYFGVEAKVLKKELLNDCPFGPEVWEVLDSVADRFGVGRADRNPVMWEVFFQTDDPQQELLIECFIVAWGKGHEDASIAERVKKSQ